MDRHNFYLFGLMLIASSLAVQVRAQDGEPNECNEWVCWGLFCVPDIKAAGTPCDDDGQHECDGRGNCVMKQLCGNGVWDYLDGEPCDPSSPYWKGAGSVCTASCKLTPAVYGACRRAGESCWSGGAGWFCSAVGACTRLCNTDVDCGGSGRCMADPIDRNQRICVAGGACEFGTSQQWVGRQGCFSTSMPGCSDAPVPPTRLCGWLSVDPSRGTVWCPAESSPCCEPQQFGGSHSSNCL